MVTKAHPVPRVLGVAERLDSGSVQSVFAMGSVAVTSHLVFQSLTSLRAGSDRGCQTGPSEDALASLG